MTAGQESEHASGVEGRVGTVDALRGLAAFAVCWFHVTNGNPEFLEAGWVKASGSPGWLGIDVFFVLSGFVIPLSLRRGGYRPREHFGRFLGKRMLRLEPPYLASLALVIALGWVAAQAPEYRGTAFEVSWSQVGAHLGYLNAFIGMPWLNPVYWTLAIEFQFYLLVAVAYAGLASDRLAVRGSVVPALLAAGFLTAAPALVFFYLPLFSLGIAAFQIRGRLLSAPLGWSLIGLAAVAAVFRLGPTRAAVGLATAIAVMVVSRTPVRPLLWLGDISYSLYLLHVPVGGRVVNLLERILPSGPLRVLGVMAAAGIALLAAWLFWLVVERPARRLASKIRYRTPAPAVNADAATGAAPAAPDSP